MSSSYSPDLRIELIGTGDQAGIWGSTTNNNLAYVLEQAIAGYVSVSVTSANQALTYINGASTVAAENQSVHSALALTTTTAANFAVYAPPASKQYTIYNASAYVATIYNSTVIGNTTAAGTGVAIPAGKTMTVWSDGTNFTQQNTHLNSPSFTTPALGTPASGTLTNCSNLPIAGITGLGTGVATFLATPSSANLASAVTDETGSGALVFATSPTLTTPALGTPSSATLTNATGLPISTGISGLGTGVATALAVSVGTAGAPVVNGGVLGTPTSGTLTNATGLPISTGVSGLGTGVATFLATPSSANLASAVTGETGSGALVFATSPTLVTPALGTPSSGTLTNCSFPTLNQNTTGSSGSCTGNAATASNPASGGSFITSSNIGSQSVNYASTAGNGGVTSYIGATGAIDPSIQGNIGNIISAVPMEATGTIVYGSFGVFVNQYSPGATKAGSSLAGYPGVSLTGFTYNGNGTPSDNFNFAVVDANQNGRSFPAAGTAVTSSSPSAFLYWSGGAPNSLTYATYLTGSWRAITVSYNYKSQDSCNTFISGWSAGLWMRYA